MAGDSPEDLENCSEQVDLCMFYPSCYFYLAVLEGLLRCSLLRVYYYLRVRVLIFVVLIIFLGCYIYFIQSIYLNKLSLTQSKSSLLHFYFTYSVLYYKQKTSLL